MLGSSLGEGLAADPALSFWEQPRPPGTTPCVPFESYSEAGGVGGALVGHRPGQVPRECLHLALRCWDSQEEWLTSK